MKAKDLTIFKIIFYENNRGIPVTYRDLEYTIHDGVLELYNIAGYPQNYRKYYSLNSISNFTVNFEEDED